jgi:hypothetical protein
MTATAMAKEIKQVEDMLALTTRPVVIHTCPVQTYHKFSVVKRPATAYGLMGISGPDGVCKPGLWQVLERIYLGQFLKDVRAGHRSIIYFKNNVKLGAIYRNLQVLTGQRDPWTADFAMCHSSLLPADEKMLQARRDDITLYLASNKLLLGTDLRKIDMVIFTAPFDQPAALLQGAGRMSRRTGSGFRGAGQAYQLWNGSDLTKANKNMTEEMKQICREGETACTKSLLRKLYAVNTVKQSVGPEAKVLLRKATEFKALQAKVASCSDTTEMVRLLAREKEFREGLEELGDEPQDIIEESIHHCCSYHDSIFID